MHVDVFYINGRYRIICPCGFVASGFTMEGAGRAYDVHSAEKFPLPSSRRPCDPSMPADIPVSTLREGPNSWLR